MAESRGLEPVSLVCLVYRDDVQHSTLDLVFEGGVNRHVTPRDVQAKPVSPAVDWEFLLVAATSPGIRTLRQIAQVPLADARRFSSATSRNSRVSSPSNTSYSDIVEGLESPLQFLPPSLLCEFLQQFVVRLSRLFQLYKSLYVSSVTGM